MHKHAEFIKAFVDGKTVLCNEQDLNETEVFNNTWVKVERLSWFDLDGVNFKIEEPEIPAGYITEECPPGYVAKADIACWKCAFITNGTSCGDISARCMSTKRKDRKNVIFIRKEDAK